MTRLDVISKHNNGMNVHNKKNWCVQKWWQMKKNRRGKRIMLLDSTGGPKYIVGFSRIQDRSLQGPPVLNTRNITC